MLQCSQARRRRHMTQGSHLLPLQVHGWQNNSDEQHAAPVVFGIGLLLDLCARQGLLSSALRPPLSVATSPRSLAARRPFLYAKTFCLTIIFSRTVPMVQPDLSTIATQKSDKNLHPDTHWHFAHARHHDVVDQNLYIYTLQR